MRPKAVSRRELQRSNNRAQILQTSVELFSTHGYHDVSMHQIAEESGFSIGTLYNFFRDKEDLYGELVREYFYQFHDELVSVIEGPGDEVERIRAYVSAKGRIFEKNMPMMRLYFAETRGIYSGIKSGLNGDLRIIYEKFIERLAAVFESGIRKGLFRKLMEPYYLAMSLASLTNTFLLLWLEDPEKHPYSKNVETIMQVLFESILIQSDEVKTVKKVGRKNGRTKA
jgi:TetR/AcrR family transcriptional regulator